MTTVIIPAAGNSTRWGRPYPKQMAQIGRESIIQRLVRQCHERDTVPIVLAHDAMLIAHLPTNTTLLNPARHRWLAETLESTRTLWQGRMVILLGDVVFHPRLLNRIWTDGQPIQFYGTPAEIYALVFMPGAYGIIDRAMRIALAYAERNPQDQGAGKLWSVYKAVVNWPQPHEIDFIQKYFTFIRNEYTQDIDDTNTYELFLREVVYRGLLDDEVMA